MSVTVEIAEPVTLQLKFPVTDSLVTDAKGKMILVSRIEFNVHTPDKVAIWFREDGEDWRETVRMVRYQVSP